MFQYEYIPKGTCSKKISIELEGDTIKKVAFEGGCNGNLKGISQLLQDMDVSFAVERLAGTICGQRNTSCPDQLAKALQEASKAQKG